MQKVSKYFQSKRFDEICNFLKERQCEGVDIKGFYHRKSGDGLVHLAIHFGRRDVMKLLHIEYGFNLEQQNFDGKRPLHEAAQYGQLECLSYLLMYNVQVDSFKRADWTPLMLSCTKNNVFVVEKLLNSGADITLKNKDGWNAFHLACREGNIEIIKLLLLKRNDVWKTRSNNERTPLHTVALHGKKEALEFLLDTVSYDTDSPDSCGSTPLMDAVRGGHLDCADILVTRHKADVLRCDNMGRQCVHLAAQAEQLPILNWLVCACAVDVNVQSPVSGATPLHVACKEGQDKAVEALISYGANRNLKDHKGRAALEIARACRHNRCVAVLQNGADVHNTDMLPGVS